MKSNRTRQRILRYCLVALFTFTVCAPMAVLAGRTATVTIKVTVAEVPPCTINGNRVIEVDFSDVIVTQIDGNRYLQPINYSLECTGQSKNAMKLAIQGNPATFDNTALKTNVKDFGIALRANGQPLVVNKWIDFVYPNKPDLQAVPVKRAGVDLPGGEFSAGATLMVQYQ